ncbi:hypothetical protein GCM10011609_27950 [Lentzea pudingi]|uniref:YjzC-like protein n=1 Tax=Lentzea pudingi TaxID=1789439 RepID=A0ABQ2HRG0_9PSEU|nr:hypothetical protein [Lentzea pudingi]GGM89466.1 hypothetical protein GCM10011609_27950 [Lentzea pudingi]
MPTEVTMRWQEVTYARNADGTVHMGPDNKPVVENVGTKERVFPNRPEVNYAPQSRYKGR